MRETDMAERLTPKDVLFDTVVNALVEFEKHTGMRVDGGIVVRYIPGTDGVPTVSMTFK